MNKKISALTFDVREDGWDKSQGFIMRQMPMPVLDEKNVKDADSLIVKIRYAGICGTDRNIWHRNSFKDLIHSSLLKEAKTTRILGHEFVGEIVEAGSMVESLHGIGKGSIVSGDSHVTCGKCYQCKIGQNNVCLNEQILGVSLDGVFAEYVKLPAKNLWPIDTKVIRPEIAAIFDPMGNAIHVLSKVDVRGQSVAVFGCGAIGLFSIVLLKQFGAANIIAVDINLENLKLAKELGAHHIMQITKDNNQEMIKKILQLTGDRGVDIAIEMAGPTSSVNNALESVRRGGQVMLFGLKDGDFLIPKFSSIITKGLTLHGVIGRRIFSTWQILSSVLSDTSNGIQEKIWNVILKEGIGPVLNFSDFNKEDFKQAMDTYPKIIFKF